MNSYRSNYRVIYNYAYRVASICIDIILYKEYITAEMDGPSLNESTLSVDNRTLIQYTVEDIKETVESIRYYENNKDKLLDGVTVSRFDVIG